MSKYDKLWEYVFKDGRDQFTLSFEEIGRITGVPIDHAFLTDQKERMGYGYRAGRILMKEQTIAFRKRG